MFLQKIVDAKQGNPTTPETDEVKVIILQPCRLIGLKKRLTGDHMSIVRAENIEAEVCGVNG